METKEPTTVDTREFSSPLVEACEIIIIMNMWNNKMNCVKYCDVCYYYPGTVLIPLLILIQV